MSRRLVRALVTATSAALVASSVLWFTATTAGAATEECRTRGYLDGIATRGASSGDRSRLTWTATFRGTEDCGILRRSVDGTVQGIGDMRSLVVSVITDDPATRILRALGIDPPDPVPSLGDFEIVLTTDDGRQASVRGVVRGHDLLWSFEGGTPSSPAVAGFADDGSGRFSGALTFDGAAD